MFWSPAGDRLAYLSNWMTLDQPSMALRVVEFDAEAVRARTLAEDNPSTSPWRAQASNCSPTSAASASSCCRWTAPRSRCKSPAVSSRRHSGRRIIPHLVYAVADAAYQRLIVTNVAGQELTELTDFPGRISFAQPEQVSASPTS